MTPESRYLQCEGREIHVTAWGAGHDEVAGLLAVRDAQALAALVGAWTPETATRVRAAFTAYGCCTVTDPIDELTALNLLTKD